MNIAKDENKATKERKNSWKGIGAHLDRWIVPAYKDLNKERVLDESRSKILLDLQYVNNDIETLRNFLYSKIGTGEQVDPLIVASYIRYQLCTICVCKAGESSRDPVDSPDVSKFTYWILLYYLSHLRIKKDSNADLAIYKTRTMKRVKDILRVSNVMLPFDQVDTLNSGDISLSIIASNQEVITLTAIYDLFLGHANIVLPIKSLRWATVCKRGKDIITLNLLTDYISMYEKKLQKMFKLNPKHYVSIGLVWYHRALNLVPKSAYSAIACPNCYMYLATRLYFKGIQTFGGTRLDGTSYYQMILLAVRTSILETANPDNDTLNLNKESMDKFKKLADCMNIHNEEMFTLISLRVSLYAGDLLFEAKDLAFLRLHPLTQRIKNRPVPWRYLKEVTKDVMKKMQDCIKVKDEARLKKEKENPIRQKPIETK
ncbi:hypothetical protein A3Q56_08266 [Intoshia linei]|uniref:Nucleocapsid protein n=1 Tax=Intoshia linei TaxID=1819745 RepID=A0A177AQE6_9BILA|nr:hypothetical protein A3Q56_08266 [Intoshia linei]